MPPDGGRGFCWYCAKSGNVADDRHIIGRVDKNHLRLLRAEQEAITFRIERVCAQYKMIADLPEVARSRNCKDGSIDLWDFVIVIVIGDRQFVHRRGCQFRPPKTR
jgi:hypothetical protein